MGIFDKDLELSDAQSLANKANGAKTVSTVTIDLTGGATLKDGWGNIITYNAFEGRRMKWNLNVNAALVGAGAALLCTLVTKATGTAMSNGATELARVTIPAVAAAGTKFSIGLPTTASLRYLAAVYTVSGGTLASAKLDSWIGIDHDTPSH